MLHLAQAKAGASSVAIVTGADSGPPDPNSRNILQYDAAFKQLSDAGVGLAGYVSTKYGARPIADVTADITAWYDQHSGQMSGIFLDEYAEKVSVT
jgi:Spherulation-specific family 4